MCVCVLIHASDDRNESQRVVSKREKKIDVAEESRGRSMVVVLLFTDCLLRMEGRVGK